MADGDELLGPRSPPMKSSFTTVLRSTTKRYSLSLASVERRVSTLLLETSYVAYPLGLEGSVLAEEAARLLLLLQST
jgi:hypothetical protein